MKLTIPIALLVACAACGTLTPQQREVAIARAIVSANDSATTSLDFGIITADQGEAIQATTRTATADLKKGIAARRAGAPRNSWDRFFDLAETALVEVARIIEGRK